MSRFTPHPLSGGLRLIVAGLLAVLLHGCGVMTGAPTQPWRPAGQPDTVLERNRFAVTGGDDVIGRLAVMRLEAGDTLPDVARHFSLGINAIGAANPGVDLWVPRAGERITLPLSFILPDAPREGIVINLATRRLFQFKKGDSQLTVTTYPVGVGADDRPTPVGEMCVVRKATRPTWYVPASIAEAHRKKGDPLPAEVPPGPDNPLGEFALYLSKSSYLIHGTNKPASVGLNATNGCLRLYPENVQQLYHDTPVNTPVLIVDQPYLIGRREGVLYLEAHTPAADTAAREREKIQAKLREMEKKAGRPLDWQRVKEVLGEARGIPVPIFEMHPGSRKTVAQPVEVAHPQKLHGRPEIPELNLTAWYVLAADVPDEIEARRLAAIINHQGPPIPARVLSKKDRFRVIAGPFTDVNAARNAARRLKIDLGLDGILVEPARK
ncbi:MAG: peptidase [Deltaproteobacteria bacterium]|nr:MAG: peptidase [Deltaproteobacteria bacterium]